MFIKIKEPVIKWAIEYSRKPLNVIVAKFKDAEKWEKESQDITLSLTKAKSLASFLYVPFAFLLLDNPPAKINLEAEFRTINNESTEEFSRDLSDTILDMKSKQGFLSEFREENGYERISFPDISKDSPKEIMTLMGLAPGFQINNRLHDPESVFAFVRQNLEKKGFVIFKSGIVGSNTRRKLNPKEFRGFALKDSYAPLIFINRNDAPTAQNFTLIHEAIHLMKGDSNDLISSDEETANERMINGLVSEILAPEEIIKDAWKSNDYQTDLILRIGKIGRTLGLSIPVIAIRLKELDLISSEKCDEIVEEDKANFVPQRKEKGGADYFDVVLSKLSSNFTASVIDGINSEELSITEGARLLGINPWKFFKLQERVEGK